MSNLSGTVEKKIMPVMTKISNNKIIKAITAGMMATMPLTLGTCLIAIAVNFPVTAWTTWLAEKGIDQHMNAVINGTSQLIGLYIAFTIAYSYGKSKGHDGITSGVLSLGSFIILMPQQIQVGDTSILALTKDYLGSTGIFGAMIIAIVITSIYCYLDEKGLVIRMPDSVPEMVSKSLSPTIISVIIFTFVLGLRIIFALTPYGNMYDFISQTIGIPIMKFGASPLSLLIVLTLMNFFWFFGIHPNTILSIYMPVLITAGTANLAAFQSGQPMPYLTFSALYGYLILGGQGSTLGLAIIMCFASKSERFKAMGRLSIVPALFNINEPLIFGTPIMLNPIFFIPMVFSSAVGAIVGMTFINLGAHATMNPTISLPWTMPAPIGAAITTGLLAAAGLCCAIVATALLYFPFFKYADKQALKEEQQEAGISASI